MAKYRKKPVVIDALQLRWDTWQEMCDFAGVGNLSDGKPQGCYIDEYGQPSEHPSSNHEMGMTIPTLEGLHIARQNDWIIRGIKGELYPCKPDIFEATYEAVEG
jgi:hypothetical protein